MNIEIELPGYTIEKEIGRGGMSKVYHAHQHNFAIEVALKIMDISLLRSPDFGVRFFEEARTMKRLHHGNIAEVHDVGQYGNYFYLSMEYLEGDLKSRSEGGIGTEQCLKVVAEIASALDYIHKQGFVHRDVKPENVLFRKDGAAVLTDFGIARAVEGNNDLTKTGMVIGTANYMSPEQAKGQTVDFRSDIYSLGVLLYEMLTGELPYKGSSSVSVGIKHITEPLPELTGSQVKFQSVINKAMAKQPEDRYSSCADLIADLQRASQGQQGNSENGTVVMSRVGITSTAMRMKAPLPNTASAISHSGGQDRLAVDGLSKNRVFLLTGVCALVIVIGGYAFWSKREESLPVAVVTHEDFATQFSEGAVLNKQEPVVPDSGPEIEKPENKPLQESPEQKIADLLQKANEYYSSNVLSTPRGKNAYDSYRQVLEIDPSNSEALKGVTRIVEKYQELAEAKIAQEDYPAAEDFLKRAMKLAPGNKRLPELLSQVDEGVRKQQAEQLQQQAELLQQQVNRLLKLGAEKVRNGNLVSPAQDNALFYYQKVLEIDPDNNTAKEKLKEAGNQKLPDINLAISQGQFDRAKRLIDGAEQLYPDNSRLIEPKKRYSDLQDLAANIEGPHITASGIAKASAFGKLFSGDGRKNLSVYFNYVHFSKDSSSLTLKLLNANRSKELAKEYVAVNATPARKVVSFENEAGFEDGWYEMDILSGDRFMHTLRFQYQK